MAKATLSRIMKRGHEIARKLEGDYWARLSYGLKVAWAEYKGGNKVEKTDLRTRVFIQLGQQGEGRKTYNISIEKETEKAIQVAIEETTHRKNGKTRVITFHEWLPKSQIAVLGDYIAVADWLPKEKGIPAVEVILDVSNRELKEQTGLDLLEVTASDRLALVKKGLAHIQN